MVELERSSDPVRLSVVRSVLADADIPCVLFDAGAGGLWHAAVPVRVMVADGDLELARRALGEAGIPSP